MGRNGFSGDNGEVEDGDEDVEGAGTKKEDNGGEKQGDKLVGIKI